jgi:hypothetical protein
MAGWVHHRGRLPTLFRIGGLRRLQAVGGFGGARLLGGEEGQGVMYEFCRLMRWDALLILGKVWQAPSADQRYHGYFLHADGRRLPRF